MSNNNDYILGVDLDDTGFKYHLGLKKTMMDNNPTLSDNDFPEMTDYCFVKSKWPTLETQEDYNITHINSVHNGLFTTLEVYDKFPETIIMLREQGIIIRIITHRLFPGVSYATSISDTAKALEKAKIEYDEICFSKRKYDINCDAIVDDSPKNIKEWKEKTNNLCFIFDQPYNQNIAGTRVKTWEELGEKVLTHKKQLGK